MTTHTPSNGDFSFVMDIVKGDMNDEGKMIIKGLASNTEIDVEDHRFTRMGLESIQKAIEEGLVDEEGDWNFVPLRSGHGREWNDQLGWITKAEIDDNDNLWITAELDDTSATAVSLYNKVSRGNRHGRKAKLGMSVKGKTTKFTVDYDAALGRRVWSLNNLLVEEVSVTGAPKNPKAYSINIVKSLLADPEYKKAMEEPMDNLEVTKGVDAEASETLDKERAEGAEVITHVTEDAANETEALEVAQEQNAANNAEAAQYVVTPTPQVSEEVVVQDANEATPEPSAIATLAQTVADIQNSVQELSAAIANLQNQEADVQKSTIEPAQVENAVTIEAIPENLDDRIADAVTKALSGLGLEGLAKDIAVVKSNLAELSTAEADRSISVSKAKSNASHDPITRMRDLIDKGDDGISAAFKSFVATDYE